LKALYKYIISTGLQSDIRPCLAIADIFVFPSYREGFPNVVMQAGAMELPCIVTDINGCNEIIEDGVNGLIIPSKDEKALQEKMELLLNDSDLRVKLKSRAREMIVSATSKEWYGKPYWKNTEVWREIITHKYLLYQKKDVSLQDRNKKETSWDSTNQTNGY
jgi:glycosyltransferase involved in cell wall biosynthesis